MSKMLTIFRHKNESKIDVHFDVKFDVKIESKNGGPKMGSQKMGGPKMGPKMGYRTEVHRISKDICPCLQGEHTFGIWTHPNRPQI